MDDQRSPEPTGKSKYPVLRAMIILAWALSLIGHVDPAPIFGKANFVIDAFRSFPLYFLALQFLAFFHFDLSTKRSPISALCALGCILSAAHYCYLLAPLYDSDTEPRAPEATDATFLYANVFLGRADVSKFKRFFNDFDPEIVGLVEVTEDFIERSGIRERYPFKIEYPGRTTEGVALYSKLPMEAVNSGLEQSFFRSIAARIVHSDQEPFDVFLIHAPPPHVDKELSWRRQFYEDLIRMARGSKTVIFGDFNMTPYTSLFREFLDRAEFTNAMSGFGAKPTWHLDPLPLMTTIDGAVHGKEWRCMKFEVLERVGSDHDPILFSLQDRNKEYQADR